MNANNKYEIALTGTSFGTDMTNTKMRIDGEWQTTAEVTDTAARFEIINATDLDITKQVEVLFPEGVPAGHNLLDAELLMTPKLTKITPNSGSIAGSVIYATVEGVGINTEETFELMSGNKKLCSAVEVVSYSQIKCTTKADLEVAADTVLTLQGTEEYTCANSDTTQCKYT
mmetsp:Transcript_20899/g.32333  ORF Transcript_20899/g.32333 Transcript_20899/m.32333 type:complete len:172 (-) Transcript_20899:2223-2738(-)